MNVQMAALDFGAIILAQATERDALVLRQVKIDKGALIKQAVIT